MKKIVALVLISAFATGSLTTGCEAAKNTNNTQRGAGIGVAAGAVIGGILGNNLGKGGNTALGAVIGGVVGGAVGGSIGNKMDKQAREIEQALPGAEVNRVEEGIVLVLGENSVNFETSKSVLTPTAKANLDKVVPVFQSYADTDIVVYGYTDSTGRLEFNQKLSEDRAASVRTYLVSKGLSAARFKTRGMGPNDPIASNETVEGRSKNRRVEFTITANEKMIKDTEAELKD
ncbi:MAG TPA: OmpA family protein [Flavobacterium sp.]|uniref:OmpA family protein n=1 Tax=unclassified Flavobacterium TaxID=196869 RepID=UPI0025C2219F|nr:MULTISPECIES: OmpA family protein [unclassified Flavobacterium]HRE79288.1 OmpA family protein [Flavobacterium sp.]